MAAGLGWETVAAGSEVLVEKEAMWVVVMLLAHPKLF